ncbi:nuclear transport factor 2 family protein [Nocardia pseudovaccinii]|uniref:nuclear transport factor 2 family protein n=1 Tax=Nocardia pseudovaccinii TaxID=189540 RepID=UPI003D90D49A
MSDSTEAAVAAAVRNLIGRHIQAQDAGDSEAVVALYTADGVLEIPGADPISGQEALREAFKGWAPTQPQRHLGGNTVITSWTEDSATAVSDVVFFQRGEAGWAVGVVGRYEDTFTRQDGNWKLQRRKTTYEA